MVRIYTEDDFVALGELLAERKEIFILYDINVESWALEIERMLPQQSVRARKALHAGEELKCLAGAEMIASWLLENEADRDAMVLVVGGGTVTDIAGFVSSIFKRGLSFAYVPTTLLAQVDAAIGGKTGVNFLNYKNMLGTFCHPQFTYICPRVLETLPEREFLSGVAELLKTFLVSDGEKYAEAVECLSGQVAVSSPALKDLIHAAAMTKAGVVERDFTEKGERRYLNLGHSFGHAIEWYGHHNLRDESFQPMTHGEAVAVGTIMAAALGEELGISPIGLRDRLIRDFSACRLPVSTEIPRERLLDAIRQDKKASSGKVGFVLLEEIGRPTVFYLPIEQL